MLNDLFLNRYEDIKRGADLPIQKRGNNPLAAKFSEIRALSSDSPKFQRVCVYRRVNPSLFRIDIDKGRV